jgi:hypothetical protein
MWACAVLQRQHGPLVAGLTLAAERSTGEMDARHIATALWSLARLDAPMESTANALLAAVVLERLGTVNAQDIATMLWALAKMKIPVSNELRARIPPPSVQHDLDCGTWVP